MTKLVKNLIIGGSGTTVVAGTATGVGVGVAHKNKADDSNQSTIKQQAQVIAQNTKAAAEAQTALAKTSNENELALIEAKIAAFDAQRNAEFHQAQLAKVETLIRKYVAKQNAKAAQEALANTEAHVADFVALKNAEYQAAVQAEVSAWVAQQNLNYKDAQIAALKVKAALDHKKLVSQKTSEVQEAVEVTTKVNTEDQIDTALAALEARLNALSAEQAASQNDKQAQSKLAADQVRSAELSFLAHEAFRQEVLALRSAEADKKEASFIKETAEEQERLAKVEAMEEEFQRETARIQQALSDKEVANEKHALFTAITSEDATRAEEALSTSRAERAAKMISELRDQLVILTDTLKIAVNEKEFVLNAFDAETSTTSQTTEIVAAFHNAITMAEGIKASELDAINAAQANFENLKSEDNLRQLAKVEAEITKEVQVRNAVHAAKLAVQENIDFAKQAAFNKAAEAEAQHFAEAAAKKNAALLNADDHNKELQALNAAKAETEAKAEALRLEAERIAADRTIAATTDASNKAEELAKFIATIRVQVEKSTYALRLNVEQTDQVLKQFDDVTLKITDEAEVLNEFHNAMELANKFSAENLESLNEALAKQTAAQAIFVADAIKDAQSKKDFEASLVSWIDKNGMDDHREAMLVLVRNAMRNDFYENLVVPEKEEDRLHPEYVKTLYLEFNEMLNKANSQEELEQVAKDGEAMIARALETQKVQTLKTEMVAGLQMEYDKAHDNIWGLNSDKQTELFGKLDVLFEAAKTEINSQQTHDDVVRVTLSSVAKFDDESLKLFTNEYNAIQKSLFEAAKSHVLQKWAQVFSGGFALGGLDSKVADELIAIKGNIVAKINAISFDVNNNEANIELIRSFAFDNYKNMVEFKNIEEQGAKANHGFHEAKPQSETQAKDLKLELAIANAFVAKTDAEIAVMNDEQFNEYLLGQLRKDQPDVITTHSPAKIEVHNGVITYTTNSGSVITLDANQLDSAIFADKDGNIKPWWANVRSALVVYIDAQEAKNFQIATAQQLERMSEVEFNSYIRNVMYKEQPDAIFSNAKFELHDGVITYTTNGGQQIDFKTFESVHRDIFLHGDRESTPQWWTNTQEALSIYFGFENEEIKAGQSAYYTGANNEEHYFELVKAVAKSKVVEALDDDQQKIQLATKIIDDIVNGKLSLEEAKEAYLF